MKILKTEEIVSKVAHYPADLIKRLENAK